MANRLLGNWLLRDSAPPATCLEYGQDLWQLKQTKAIGHNSVVTHKMRICVWLRDILPVLAVRKQAALLWAAVLWAAFQWGLCGQVERASPVALSRKPRPPGQQPTRDWMLPAATWAWREMLLQSSHQRPRPWLTPWLRPCETLSSRPSWALPRYWPAEKLRDNKCGVQATAFEGNLLRSNITNMRSFKTTSLNVWLLGIITVLEEEQ